jgi:vacuolar-type H+-ATPase subunit E/Vma4
MSQTSLVEKIAADAAAEVAAITAASEAEVTAVQKKTDEQLAALKAARATAEQKKLDQMELVAVSQAKQAGKIALQKAKREQIDLIFAEVLAELVAQPAETYVAYFTKVATGVVASGTVATRVQAPATREAETKQILEQLGVTGPVVVDTAINAGLVVHTAAGVYDFTLGRLMNEQRSELEMEVVQQVMNS